MCCCIAIWYITFRITYFLELFIVHYTYKYKKLATCHKLGIFLPAIVKARIP